MDPEQIAAIVGMEPYACRKRLADLQRAKQAETTGELVPTTSGRHQRVWRAL
jgi:predicted ArsR family transcriptional regulator